MELSMRQQILIQLKESLIQILTFNYFAIRKIIKKEFIVKVTDRVLDIGCGTGLYSQFFPINGYIGIDIGEKPIAFAQKKYGCMFKVMDATKLTFSKGFFDKVIVVGVIHHLNDDDFIKACEGIKRVLKKNGQILIIEAIPPILKFNFIGAFLRSLDEGKYIRTNKDYQKTFSCYFTILKSYSQLGGLLDYAVFFLKN